MNTNKMTFSSVTHISFSRAFELIEKRFSCMELIEDERDVLLMPKYALNYKFGVRLALDNELFAYSPRFSGLPIAYNQVRVSEVESRIIDDQPMVVLHARLSVIVFKPVVGAVLCGVVNKLGVAHIGCVVQDCFNARVYFQAASHKHETLTNEQAMFINEITVGSRLLFRVSKLSARQDLLQITGSIEHRLFRDDAEEMDLDRSTLVTDNGNSDTYESHNMFTEAIPLQLPVSEERINQSKKKKKKIKHSDDTYNSSIPVEDNGNTDTFDSHGINFETHPDNVLFSEELNKKVKKRKHKERNTSSLHIGGNGHAANYDSQQTIPEMLPVEPTDHLGELSKKSKKKEEEKGNAQLENLQLSRETLQEIVDSDANQNVLPEKIPIPSKKSRIKTTIVNEPFIEEEQNFTKLKNNQSIQEDNDSPVPKKKKKKQKHEVL